MPDDIDQENIPPPPPPILEEDAEDNPEKNIDELAELMNAFDDSGQDLDQEASASQFSILKEAHGF